MNDYKIGSLLLKYYSHNNCFCNFVKSQKCSCNNCYILKYKLLEKAQKIKSPFYGRCYMGLEKFIFPVFIGKTVIGYFTVGEFYSDRKQAESYLEKKSIDINCDCKVLKESFLILHVN